ncbi:ABC transporter ATP-binding protein [Marinitenerispora sediminis]|uniref:ABC transporter ATP-binding protein n=1 Tax=Marinitenerispora sediminis TaxID=1931232 RepID=A0A368T462_9ACTN|nr:ABC transporter ATP-binding protein [Marinitenerispora sediminis]RCV53637.1 ABC transporter ATP-binding protein [Marinitenerispora sediminis]RCV57927.1 ABC transporter ATP-binding protein [Marinitenerispora sediminis]
MNHRTSVAVALHRVTAGYGPRTVLREIDASVPARRVTALVGPNGSGKSTLLGVVSGVHAPVSGTVERFHRERPALVVQRSAVPDTLPVTVRETVAMGRWAHRGLWRRLTADDRAVVATCMARLDIADLADRPLGALSGGQRQRALLAQGLAQQSDLLLLDEPTTGLDTAAQRAILDVLADLRAEGVTVVFATHDAEAARWADHRLHLRDGRLAIGTGPEPTAAPSGSTAG